MDSHALVAIAVKAAQDAGDLLLKRFGETPEGVSTKATPTDAVSDADHESEALIVQAIKAARPEDGILAEEGGGAESSSDLQWIVDPLDGTVNYLFGIPAWVVSIAVHDSMGGVAAVIHDPNRNETFTAVRGGGAELNGDPVRVSDRDDLATALIGTGFAYDASIRKAQAEWMLHVLPRVRDVRRVGSAALDLAWVACGRLDGHFEASLKIWDKAAGELLIREAGGVVSDLPVPLGDDHSVLAAGPALHGQLSKLVRGGA